MSLSQSHTQTLRVSPALPDESTNLLSRSEDQAEQNEVNPFRPLLYFWGPKIPLFERNSLYYFLSILILQRIYYYNSYFLLSQMLTNTFEIFRSSGYILSILLLSLPVLLAPFLGYLSDLPRFPRHCLLNVSLVLSFVSSLLLAVCYAIMNFTSLDDADFFQNIPQISLIIIQILSIISLLLFILGFALFLPLSCPYGLDILNENGIPTLILYFSMFYVANNIGSVFAYFKYLSFPANQLFYHSIAVIPVIFSAWLMLSIGRCSNILPRSPLIHCEYSFRSGFGVVWQALKRRLVEGKTIEQGSILKYALRDHGGSYRLNMVRGTSSLVKINASLSMLLLVFGVYGTITHLFPTQSDFLSWPVLRNISETYCYKQNYVHFDNISFVDFLSVILFAPIFEYFFFDLTFGFRPNSSSLPWCIKCIRIEKLRKLTYYTRDMLRRYLLVENLLKRMFYGLILMLVGILVALIIDIFRVKADTEQLICNKTNNTIQFSNLSIFIQIPQYAFIGFLEVVTLIGSLQFVFYQCNKHFGSAMKGFFFGLYYFYLGLGNLIVNIFYLTFEQICFNYGCDYCVVYTQHCNAGELTLTWIPLAFAFCICFIFNFVPFFFFAHSRQWKLDNEVEYDGHPIHIIVNL